MNKVLLIRLWNKDTGSEGILFFGEDSVRSLELPWRDNEPSYSCIPEGTYKVIWWKSPSKGWCYRVTNVKNRDYILIHSATFAGDRKKGLQSHLRGCIALGKHYGIWQGQRGIFVSKPSVRKFNEVMGSNSFILEIKNADSYIINS